MSSASSNVSYTNFKDFVQHSINPTFLRDMEEDIESRKFWPNQTSREVHSGHFVKVKTEPIHSPELVVFSEEMGREIGLEKSIAKDKKFIQFVSGDVSSACKDIDKENVGVTWATPYALSIYGTPYTDNCPFKSGKGYGDGRASSIFESKFGWELQLKGSGPTPFCRGADGRAVLRSSVREFLASEAMNNMRVSTTRALSLVVSKNDTVLRPWYSPSHTREMKDVKIPDLNDSRLHGYPMEMRKQLIDQLKYKMKQPNSMIPHKTAITCRTAKSFIRIGHFDLFARRVQKGSNAEERKTARRQLDKLIMHTIKREFASSHDFLGVASICNQRFRLSNEVFGNCLWQDCEASGRLDPCRVLPREFQ